MIRIQDLPAGGAASVVRFYSEPDPKPMADYHAVCTLWWESAAVVWMHGLKGNGTRALWREFVQALADRGVRTIKATRAAGRILPRARQMPEGHYEMQIADLLTRPVETGFGPP